MGQRATWDLPDDPDPTGDRCFLVRVPDDPKHLAAFRGALYELAKPYAWGNDDAHTALIVGERWLTNWLAIEEVDCDMLHQTLIAFDPDCGLQWSYDGGATWTTVSFEACALAGGQQAIEDALNDGTLQRAGGQPGPDNPPAPGECRTYHVILRGSDRWQLPSPVNAGDTIQITNAVGGWTDGTLAWYCPDGSRYLLSACSADLKTHESGDPLNPGAYHMQVIGGYNAGTPVYFDASAYTIPSGVIDQECWLQANDETLEDNQGQIEFDVEICTGTWCYKFDFTTGLHGWTLYDTDVMHQDATGLWSDWHSGHQDGVYISNAGSFTGKITEVIMTLDSALTGGNPQATVTNYPHSPLTYLMNIHASQTVYAVQGAWNASAWSFSATIDPNDGGSQSMTAHLLSIEFHGTGDNPFGADNC